MDTVRLFPRENLPAATRRPIVSITASLATIGDNSPWKIAARGTLIPTDKEVGMGEVYRLSDWQSVIPLDGAEGEFDAAKHWVVLIVEAKALQGLPENQGAASIFIHSTRDIFAPAAKPTDAKPADAKPSSTK